MEQNDSEMKQLHEATEKAFRAQHEQLAELKVRTLEVEQKLSRRPRGGGFSADGGPGEMADMILKSDQMAAFQKGSAQRVKIAVPPSMFKTAILNAAGLNQALVPPDYRPGISIAPQRRITIRDLFNQVPTQSNLIVWAKETAYTSNAGPQYAAGTPATTEGAIKNESAMSYALANTPVVTLAHWIPASEQILDDAPTLEQYLSNRLLYGLKLEEEKELLQGDGTVGKLDGLIHQATAFAGGVTGLSPLDALALALGQLAAGEFEPSGFVLNPVDWFSSSILLKKDSQGRYIFGDPGEMTTPVLWGLPVVVTNSMPVGKFMALDAARTGYICDRQDPTVEIAKEHADFFIRNMVAILAEERLALVVERGAAMVYGDLVSV